MSRPRDFPVPEVFAAPHPLVFAHRGGAALGPENTLATFALGLAAGADGCECDVRLARDGVPVVIHDATLDRTTDAAGLVVARSAAELARVDACCRFAGDSGDRYVPPRRSHAGVPTLEEVLRQFAGARWIVELKDDVPALADAVAAVVSSLGLRDRVCVGSFHHGVLQRVRQVDPSIVTSASLLEARRTLTRAWLWPVRRTGPYRAFQVPERSGRLHVVTRPFVRQVHRERAVVQVWTVNTAEDVTRLLAMGVDGVISDRPDLAVAARDRWRRGPYNRP